MPSVPGSATVGAMDFIPGPSADPMIPYLFDVLYPMLHPVRASAGDRVVARPGHPTRPIVVVRRIGGIWRPVRVGPPNFGALVEREYDGIILYRPASVGSPALSEHPMVRRA